MSKNNSHKNWTLFSGAIAALATVGVIILFAGCGEADLDHHGHDHHNGHLHEETGPAEAADETETVVDAVENQQYCPVMDGMEINRDLYVDHDGKRVYFCCTGCLSVFAEEPEKYMEKLQELHAD